MTDDQTPRQTPEQQAQERQKQREAGLQAFNDLLHNRPNAVRVTRETTRDELNAALRRAAGHNTGDDAA